MSFWTTEDFELSLKSLKIPRNTKIFIHSSLGMLGIHNLQRASHSILNSFEKLSKVDIQIYFPAFTYSLTEEKVFDPLSDSGLNEMGALPLEAFSRNYFRTIDPIFSVLTNDPIFKKTDANRFSASFGPGSLFSELFEDNVMILNIGTGVGSTLLHEIERRIGVPYRFEKGFSGRFLDASGLLHERTNWNSYVRNLEIEGSEADFGYLNILTREAHFITRAKIGKTEISTYRIRDMADFIDKVIVKIPNILNKKGREELELFPHNQI